MRLLARRSVPLPRGLTHAARCRPGTQEYKSPSPPRALAYGPDAAGSEAAAREFALALRLIFRLGVSAPSISSDGCECNTALHVHVNCRNPLAPGRLLTARQILAVLITWVRFDLACGPLARSWMWMDRWSAPMFATGAEFTFNERPHLRGRAAHAQRGSMYDVRAFFAHARSQVWSLDELPTEDDRVRALFGEGCGLGKYNSLNVRPLFAYGTLEFRRMHASTDEDLVMRWAHVCATFVETCADESLLERYMGEETSHDEGLERLAVDQEAATLADLDALLQETLGAGWTRFFVDRGCGPHNERWHHDRAQGIGAVQSGITVPQPG